MYGMQRIDPIRYPPGKGVRNSRLIPECLRIDHPAGAIRKMGKGSFAGKEDAHIQNNSL